MAICVQVIFCDNQQVQSELGLDLYKRFDWLNLPHGDHIQYQDQKIEYLVMTFGAMTIVNYAMKKNSLG